MSRALAHAEDVSTRPVDPTGTGAIRRRFRASLKLGLRRLTAEMRTVVVQHDILGLSGSPLSWHSPEVRQSAMASFMIATLPKFLPVGIVRDPINRAWAHGSEAAQNDLEAKPLVIPLRGAEHLVMLAQQELAGIRAATEQNVARLVSSIVVRKVKPTQAAAAITAVLDKITRNRLISMANTMVVKAHCQAKLEVYRHAGIKRVGSIPERRVGPIKIRDDDDDFEEVGIRTAGDDLVCEECEIIAANAPYDTDDAEDLIPAHPNCRCTFFPWGDKRFKRDQEA
jgi:hypothetical protein